MSRRKKTRNVALAYPVTVPWMGLFARGVSEYARRHGGWIITTSPPTLTGTDLAAMNAFTLKGWPGDGAILAIITRAEAKAAGRLGIPVVNLAGALHTAGLPRVMVDHYAIGRLAAEHLLERGLRRMAYCGLPRLWYAQQRGRGFIDRVEEAGVRCEVFEMSGPKNVRAPWRQRVAPLDRWLRSLKPPVGLLAVHDHLARVVVDECLRLGLKVPHDVAVIGSDNDTTVCEFCQPTLSTVSRSAWRVGYEAAALLDGLMAGKDPPPDDILIPPDGIVARQSTDVVAVDDPQVATAVRFMCDHLGEPFGVDRLLQCVAVSRRQLELRFRRLLGCSPYDYLCRLRVESAKGFLDRPEYVKLQKIAGACGFSSDKHLRQVFRRLTGITPLEYHRQCHVHRAG